MEKGIKLGQKLVVTDTCDATLKDRSTGKVIATATTQLAGLSQEVNNIDIKGGIGGSTIASIPSEKEITATLRDALFNLDYVSLVSGEGIEEMEIEYLLQVTGTVEGENVVIADKEVETAYVTTTDNFQLEVEAVEGVLSVELGLLFDEHKEGDTIEVTVLKKTKGEGVTLKADSFPTKYELTYRTVAIDPVTGEHVKDIIIQLDEVQATGSLDLSFEASNPISPEIQFVATRPINCSTMGRIAVVDPNKEEIDC